MKQLALIAFVVLLMSGCADSGTESPVASTVVRAIEEPTNLDEGRDLAAELVREAVALAAGTLPVRDAPGLGDLHCDPRGSGLKDWSYGQIIDVGDANLDEIAETIWARWQALGFESDGGRLNDANPDLNVRRGDFLGSIEGDRAERTLGVYMTTPCLPPG